MKQVLQTLKNGNTEVANVPCPACRRGEVLIKTDATLVSSGTERMLVEFGKAGWIEKARKQPDKVRMVLDKIKTDGLQPTIEVVFNKLDKPIPLGYCNVGKVINIGEHVTDFSVGERVVSNGNHAEFVSVPKNLCAKIPEGVSDEEAVFTVIGAIALQGIRLVKPTLGEAVVVTGLGLIGLIAVQLLRANGCRVLGIDFDKSKLETARKFGAEVVDLSAGENPVVAANQFSRGRGVDAVVIAASTKSSDPVHQAAAMCRKRGRIVLVGVAGLELSRSDFYEKELTFQVSCSYGPGRYDANYEEKGNDYPIGYVRWTEQRNFEAVLDLMVDGSLDLKPLISHRFLINEAEKAYEIVAGSEPSMGILLEYPGGEITESSQTIDIPHTSNTRSNLDKASVSFIGSGNYASAVLIPAFKATGARLRSVASSGGVSGFHAGRKFGFEETTTDTNRIFVDKQTNIIVVTTRHNSHAKFVLKALEAGKHVFVEKPLCLTMGELEEIATLYRDCKKEKPVIMVGFNRRFSPLVEKMKSLLENARSQKAIVMTINAGHIPSDHWTQDMEVGGGRIIGEVCHFIDLLRYLVGNSIESYSVEKMGSPNGDTVSISLKFSEGSIGTVLYYANGSKSFPKERLEVFSDGKVLQLDNFKKLIGYGWPKFKKMRVWRQNKGQMACAERFIKSIEEGKAAPIPFDEIIEVNKITIEIAQGL